MARIYRSLPPRGTKLGIAFSGGLDTRCAVAWLAEQGLEVHAYTADLAQPDEKDPAEIPPIAMEHGARVARLIDCKDALVREGLDHRGLRALAAPRRPVGLGHHADHVVRGEETLERRPGERRRAVEQHAHR